MTSSFVQSCLTPDSNKTLKIHLKSTRKSIKKSGSQACLQGTARGHPGDTPKIEPLESLLGVGWPQQAVQDGPKRSSFSHCFWVIFSFRFYWIFRPNMTPKSEPKSQKTLLLNTLFLKSVLEPMFYRFASGLSAQLGLPRPSKFMKFQWKNSHFQPSRTPFFAKVPFSSHFDPNLAAFYPPEWSKIKPKIIQNTVPRST